MNVLIHFVPDERLKSKEHLNKQAKYNSLEKSHLSTIITQKSTLCGLEKIIQYSWEGALRERLITRKAKGSVRKIKD